MVQVPQHYIHVVWYRYHNITYICCMVQVPQHYIHMLYGAGTTTLRTYVVWYRYHNIVF